MAIPPPFLDPDNKDVLFNDFSFTELHTTTMTSKQDLATLTSQGFTSIHPSFLPSLSGWRMSIDLFFLIFFFFLSVAGIETDVGDLASRLKDAEDAATILRQDLGTTQGDLSSLANSSNQMRQRLSSLGK
jgi:hypothetical protein